LLHNKYASERWEEDALNEAISKITVALPFCFEHRLTFFVTKSDAQISTLLLTIRRPIVLFIVNGGNVANRDTTSF
jgi:hypothetical protein